MVGRWGGSVCWVRESASVVGFLGYVGWVDWLGSWVGGGMRWVHVGSVGGSCSPFLAYLPAYLPCFRGNCVVLCCVVDHGKGWLIGWLVGWWFVGWLSCERGQR